MLMYVSSQNKVVSLHLSFQCVLDLKANILRIGTTGTETRFLPENELPECARLSGSSEDAARQVEKMEMDKALADSRSEAEGMYDETLLKLLLSCYYRLLL